MLACHRDSCESEKRSRENSGSLRRRRWCWKAEGGESWRRFVTWLGRQTDLSFRLHGGLLGGWGVHYSSLILSEKSEANWKAKARAKWDAPRRCRGGKQRASGSKKERDVSLTRDLPRTINCGGAKIIRDLVAMTCDANKSFVPITYARLNLRSRQIRRCASVRRCTRMENEGIEGSRCGESVIHDCRLPFF